MLAFANRREDHQRLQFAGAENDGGRDRALRVQAVLVRGDHQAAAVEATVHCRREPDFFETVFLAVHGDDGVGRLVVEQQALDGDRGIIYGLVHRRHSLLVADLAAVAVEAVADAVDKATRLAVYRDGRQILEIFLDGEGRLADFLAEIVQEIVARADGVIEDLVREVQPVRLVDEVVDRAVAAGQDHTVLGSETAQEGGIAV